MVNYCCVVGCGRNSKSNKHLNFYTLPKQKNRQKKWLKAVGREELIDTDLDKQKKSLRVCSRHFDPSCIKNKHLHGNAIPSLRLPGCPLQEDEPIKHDGVICDVCSDPIVGFRYKCVTSENYDLCQKCEMREAHPDHYMLRIPQSLKFKLADNLLEKWRKLFKSEHVTVTYDESENDNASDDEPITKYGTNDNCFQLTEDVKKDIKDEIKRALESLKKKNENEHVNNLKAATANYQANQTQNTPFLTINPPSTNAFTNDTPYFVNMMNQSTVELKNEDIIQEDVTSQVPEMVFADVNQIKCNESVVKDESMPSLSVVNTSTVSGQMQPVLYLKINDVLTELMLNGPDT